MTTSKFFRAGLLPLLVPVMALGCSSGGGGGGSSVSDFCKNYAAAICQIAVTPCGLDMDTCLTYQTGQCTMLQTNATASNPKRIFTSGNTGDCINKLKAAYGSTSPISASTLDSIQTACQYVFQGPGKTNMDSCTTQFDCAGSTNGSIICDAAHKICASKNTVSGTGLCMNIGDVCSTNFYCATNSAGVAMCTADGTSAAGSACTSTTPCDSNSRCATGTCMPLVQPGGTCSVDSDCMGGDYCDHYGGAPTCDDGLQFSKGSQTCTCIAEGMNCPGSTAGAGGQGGMAGSSVSATGGANGAAGATGTGGAASGAAGSSGAAGAAGGAGGA